jgi:hypothetical protein
VLGRLFNKDGPRRPMFHSRSLPQGKRTSKKVFQTENFLSKNRHSK